MVYLQGFFICFQGFFDGVTGIVRKPVEGAKEQGVEGFFKGLSRFYLTSCQQINDSPVSSASVFIISCNVPFCRFG